MSDKPREGRSFLDTNIFVYAFDGGAPSAKRAAAEKLVHRALKTGVSVVSYQVVQEFLNVAQRKFAQPISIPDLQAIVETVFRPLLAVLPSPEFFRDALDIAGRYQLSWYDSLIVAAAAESGCSVLYSEDLQDGAKIAGVVIQNPFARETR
jgi:predicted nucleic acid-binding protein